MGDDKNGAADAQPSAELSEMEQEILNSVGPKFGVTAPKAKTSDAADGAADTADQGDEDRNGDENTSGADDDDQGSDEGDDADSDENAGDDDDQSDESEKDKASADDKKSKPGDEYTKDTKKLLNESLKDLPDDVRKRVEGVIGARIGQIVGKERTERDRMGRRVEELTAENEQLAAEKGPRVISADVHPTALIESEDGLADRKSKLDGWIDWAEDNAEGVNLPDSEGYDESKPSYTKDQIRAQVRLWRRERDELIPRVRETLRARAAGDAKLKEAFPELFDAKSAEYATAQRFIRLMPQLKRFANVKAIAAAFVLGQAELDKKLAGKTGAPAGKEKAKEKKNSEPPPRKKAPRAPGSGSQAKGSVVAREREKPAMSEAVNRAYQNPGDKKAFTNAVAAVVGDL